jgi:hypothetical protein
MFIISIASGYYLHKLKFESLKESFDDCVVDELQVPFDSNIHILPSNDDLIYANTGTSPWLHHTVQGSLPVDPSVQFKKAYYYELDNKRYINGLRKALIVSCGLIYDAIQQGNWGTSVTSSDTASDEVIAAYNACVSSIASKLNSSDALDLPGDSASPKRIQVVHDILKSYKVNSHIYHMYLIEMELVLYRENKYHAKHISLTCTAKKQGYNQWSTNVVAVKLLGVVPEDQIALYPVIASNPFEVSQLSVDNDIESDQLKQSGVNCTVDNKTKKIKCTSNTSTANAARKSHNEAYIKYAQTQLVLMDNN